MPDGRAAWIEVQIETQLDAAELVAAAVSPLTGGVELRDAGTLLATAPGRATVIVLCGPEDLEEVLREADASLASARAAGTPVDPVIVRQRPAHEDEWRDVWKQFFRATRVGRRVVVRPSWDQVPPPPPSTPAGEGQDEAMIAIDLDPGRAFGTGAHPSTRLVIRLAEQTRDRRPDVQRFLDLGTGSGILSIVAARLWPEARGLALDLDPEATACAAENFARNGITSVEIQTGGLEGTPADRDGLDLIMANIQADVLEGLAGDLVARLAPGGTLLLSGLLAGDVAGVRVPYQAVGLRLVERADDGEWSALLLTRPPPPSPSTSPSPSP